MPGTLKKKVFLSELSEEFLLELASRARNFQMDIGKQFWERFRVSMCIIYRRDKKD